MKYSAILCFGFAVFAVMPALAQSTEQSAAESAVEGATEAAEAAADAAAATSDPHYDQSRYPDSRNNPEPFVEDYWYPRIEPLDYPASSYVNKEEGQVVMSLAISATGEATGCEVTESSGFAALDGASCAVLTRDAPVFVPAKDEDGNAIAGQFKQRLNWRIKEPEFVASTAADVSMTVNADGSVTNCQILKAEGEIGEEFKKKSPCDSFNRREAVYRDENGQPVAKRVRLRFSVDVEDVTLDQ